MTPHAPIIQSIDTEEKLRNLISAIIVIRDEMHDPVLTGLVDGLLSHFVPDEMAVYRATFDEFSRRSVQ